MLNHVKTQVELLGKLLHVIVMLRTKAISAVGDMSPVGAIHAISAVGAIVTIGSIVQVTVQMRFGFVRLLLKSYDTSNATHNERANRERSANICAALVGNRNDYR